MIFKNGIVALALWTLLLGPTLCGLGVLVHACLGDRTTECHDEIQCSTDPCQILILPAAGQYNKPGDGFDLLDQAPALVVDRTGILDLPSAGPDPVAELSVSLPVSLACNQVLPLLC